MGVTDEEWDELEREADEDLRAGRYTDFATIEELLVDLEQSDKHPGG